MLKELRKKDIKLSPQAVENIQHVMTGMVLLFFIAGVAAIYWNLLPPRKDLYNELWGPAYLLVRGQSPYDTASLNTNLPAAWLPMSIGFFSPLGWLTKKGALTFWLLFSLVELALIVLLVRGKNKSIGNLVIVSALAFGFPPTVHHLILGQFSITTTLCVVGGVYLILKDRHWLGAFLLALGLTKIHLLTLPILGVSILYYQRSGLKSMFAFWGRVGVACLVLTLPLFIAYPNWIPDAIKSMLSNEPWAFPTLQKFLVLNLGSLGMGLWIASVILVILLSLFIWSRLEPITATFWNMGLAIVISPYIGSWDFVALLPLMIHTFLSASKRQKIFFILCYLLAWVSMAYLQSLSESHNHYFWWIPLWFLASAALITSWQKKQVLS